MSETTQVYCFVNGRVRETTAEVLCDFEDEGPIYRVRRYESYSPREFKLYFTFNSDGHSAGGKDTIHFISKEAAWAWHENQIEFGKAVQLLQHEMEREWIKEDRLVDEVTKEVEDAVSKKLEELEE